LLFLGLSQVSKAVPSRQKSQSRRKGMSISVS